MPGLDWKMLHCRVLWMYICATYQLWHIDLIGQEKGKHIRYHRTKIERSRTLPNITSK